MWILKWISGITVFILVLYIIFIFANGYRLQRKYENTHFPCIYIVGKMCTIQPTWEKCGGGVPEDYCERKLNGYL